MPPLRFLIPVLSCLSGLGLAAEPDLHWRPAGAGGGGALFAPSWSPHAADELWVACDMSQLFQSKNAGGMWKTAPFWKIQGNRGSMVQFTNDPNVLWCMDYTSLQGGDTWRVSRSLNGGEDWMPLANDPTGAQVYGLSADPDNSQRAILCDWNRLFFTGDGGQTWTQKFSTASGSGLRLAGALWNGGVIYVGTNVGVLASANGGTSFAVASWTGIPAGDAIVSLCGAKSPSPRLYAVTVPSGSVYNGMMQEEIYDGGAAKSVYRWDGGTTWTLKNTGLPTGLKFGLVACARNNSAVAYAAGESPTDFPALYRTADGGDTWTISLQITGNANVATGWAGDGGDRQWSYGGRIMSLGVAPNDASRVAFTDYGFVHLTTNGGAQWRQAYLNAADQNPAGALTPKNRDYRTAGLENTTCWNVTWASVSRLIGCFSDIRGIQSRDAGVAWNFNYTGHTENSMYHCVRHPGTGMLYAATGAQHDIYQSTTLTDARLDGYGGRVLQSADNGASWQLVKDFGHPVIWLALDPGNAGRLYASVIHSSNGASSIGGIWRTDNVQLGAAAAWTKLPNPPRTEGHPFTLTIRNDGSLVAGFCARRNSAGAFTASSGVFVHQAGSWQDRSHGNMQYWTKDVVVSPHDPTQQTWYACVFNGWGGPPNDKGGLYRTTNGGSSWTRLLDNTASSVGVFNVESCASDPANPDILFVTTEQDGLWWTQNAGAASPVFSRISSFPFKQPTRVFFNPHRAGEMWLTSFGHGLHVGLKPVEAWRWEQFGAERFAPMADDQSDADGDGSVNLVEYALASNPRDGRSLPQPEITLTASAVKFRYSRRYSLSDAAVTVQFSSNLKDWLDLTDAQLSVIDGVALREAQQPRNGISRLWFRLKVVKL